MAFQLIKNNFCSPVLRLLSKLTQFARIKPHRTTTTNNYIDGKIGNREVVGHSINGDAIYCDWVAYPFPGIRFRGTTKEIAALREKEKSNWKSLSEREIKNLYRASFCQTFAEMKAPTGDWKLCVANLLHAIAVSIALMLFMKKFVYSDLPKTFDDDRRRAQLKRMIDLEVNPVTGLASQFDYVNMKAK